MSRYKEPKYALYRVYEELFQSKNDINKDELYDAMISLLKHFDFDDEAEELDIDECHYELMIEHSERMKNKIVDASIEASRSFEEKFWEIYEDS